MDKAIETRDGRFYIRMHFNGFNLPANNGAGYSTPARALAAARRCGYRPELDAAAALDLTHLVGERGPRTLNARLRVASCLDAGVQASSEDVVWLMAVARTEG